MLTERVPLQNSIGEGFVIPLGPVNLVGVVAKNGMVGCGAVDVAALGKFGYPAARVRPSKGTTIENVADIISGIVRETNSSAQGLGVREGMTGREALDLLS